MLKRIQKLRNRFNQVWTCAHNVQGGFGKVLALRKRDTGEIYAVKKMKKSLIVESKYIKYIENERKVMEEVC